MNSYKMNRMEVNITQEVKDLLDKYDTERLLCTISKDYQISPTALAIYAKTVKPLPLPVLITISDETNKFLYATAQSLNAPVPLVFNFLIETVADGSKIQTKAVTRALNNYYHLLTNSLKDEGAKELFSKVLDEYADSVYYDHYQCLSEQGIADFLTISQEGKALADEMEAYRNKEG